MFVNDVEFVKLPENPIPSLVWLDTFENFESILPYGWYTRSIGICNFWQNL